MRIRVGADPELFLKNPNSGDFVSAHNLIKGNKRKPFKVRSGAVQVDGTAAEFNIDPADSEEEFVTNIRAVYEQLKEMVPGYNLVSEPVALYDLNYFQDLPDQAKELGCDPDYDAWTGRANPRPPQDRPIRTASGHIHIGWLDEMIRNPFDESHYEECREVAKQLDYYLGIYSLNWDPDPMRRMMYGKAGAFRPKPYGMEYRVMSNVWVGNEALTRWIYNAAIKAVTDLREGRKASDKYGDLAFNIINNNETNWQDLHAINLGLPELPKAA